MIKVRNEYEAWKLINKLVPEYTQDKDLSCENTNYYIENLLDDNADVVSHNRIVIKENIADKRYTLYFPDDTRLRIKVEKSKELDGHDVTIGLIETRKIFPSVTINEVHEVTLSGVVGSSYEALDDGRMGVLFYGKDSILSAHHINDVAYVKYSE